MKIRELRAENYTREKYISCYSRALSDFTTPPKWIMLLCTELSPPYHRLQHTCVVHDAMIRTQNHEHRIRVQPPPAHKLNSHSLSANLPKYFLGNSHATCVQQVIHRASNI